MASRKDVNDFVAQKSLALVGVSRSGQGFGNAARKELAKRGYAIHVVHHEADTIDGQPCAKSLKEVASNVGGVLLVTPPSVTAELVREAEAAGLRRIWMQQGAESDEAVRFCQEHGMSAVHGHCILMFAEPTGFPHSLHRWFKGLFGGLPS